MKRRAAIFSLTLLVLAIFAAPIFALSQTQLNVSNNIPGTYSITTQGPGAFVANFYQFALMVGGVLAFGVIVYGGVKYMTSAGNPSGQSDAKEWIEAALIGLLLLVGAYFVLNVVNPQLVSLNLPQLQGLNIQAPVTTGGGTTVGGGTGGVATGCAGGNCDDLSTNGFSCKAASQQPNGQSSCDAAQGMVNTLQCVQGVLGSPGQFTVTEAMPPTVPHESSCHQDGCCVDVTVNAGSCAQVQQIMNAVQTCGATAANEYAGCSGSTIYPTTQGGNIHINSIHAGGC